VEGSEPGAERLAELVSLREITDENRARVGGLRVSVAQTRFVDGVEESIAQAAETPQANPWYRAIYAGNEPVGFVMLSWDVTPSPGILGPWFLWRLLIDERHQGRGYGRAALKQTVDLVRDAGGTELLTSYVPGEGGPWPFYERFGFVPTGELDGVEIVLRLDLPDR
jgi:diamine N-acetyltransferase